MNSPVSATVAKSQSHRIPLDLDEASRREGQVFVVRERCKGCSFCVEFCPLDVLELSDGFNRKGYHPPHVAPGKAHACVACGFCTLVCPEYAIFSMPIAKGGAK